MKPRNPKAINNRPVQSSKVLTARFPVRSWAPYRIHPTAIVEVVERLTLGTASNQAAHATIVNAIPKVRIALSRVAGERCWVAEGFVFMVVHAGQRWPIKS